MTARRKLSEVAKTIRSKNAGVDKITFDVIFRDRTTSDQVRESGVLSRAAVCRIFAIEAEQISDHVEFDPALAIKFTSTAECRASAPATPMSSAVNNMVRSSTSKCQEFETSTAASSKVSCKGTLRCYGPADAFAPIVLKNSASKIC
jgi:hypothetical protein